MSLGRARMVGVLERLVRVHAAPAVTGVDYPSEFSSRRQHVWAYQHGFRLIFSRSGKPMDKPFMERFNGRLRGEYLNLELLFWVAEDVQLRILPWQKDYTEIRRHSARGGPLGSSRPPGS